MGNGKMKRGDHLDRRGGGGILLLTLVSQLNPLASAINIFVMMSDEPPRRTKRTSYFRMTLKGGKRKSEKERAKKKGWDE